MALSNAERQRRFRERRNAKAAIVDNGHADIAAVYEILRRQWLLSDKDDAGPSEREFLERIAATPAGMRPPGERMQRVVDEFAGAVAKILDQTYRSKIQGKRRIDRKRVTKPEADDASEDLSIVTTRAHASPSERSGADGQGR